VLFDVFDEGFDKVGDFFALGGLHTRMEICGFAGASG
jgi:hypothetical protein